MTKAHRWCLERRQRALEGVVPSYRRAGIGTEVSLLLVRVTLTPLGHPSTMLGEGQLGPGALMPGKWGGARAGKCRFIFHARPMIFGSCCRPWPRSSVRFALLQS